MQNEKAVQQKAIKMIKGLSNTYEERLKEQIGTIHHGKEVRDILIKLFRAQKAIVITMKANFCPLLQRPKQEKWGAAFLVDM